LREPPARRELVVLLERTSWRQEQLAWKAVLSAAVAALALVLQLVLP
jgi:hypothetical protein